MNNPKYDPPIFIGVSIHFHCQAQCGMRTGNQNQSWLVYVWDKGSSQFLSEYVL